MISDVKYYTKEGKHVFTERIYYEEAADFYETGMYDDIKIEYIPAFPCGYSAAMARREFYEMAPNLISEYQLKDQERKRKRAAQKQAILIMLHSAAQSLLKTTDKWLLKSLENSRQKQ